MIPQFITGVKHLFTCCTSVHETVWKVNTLQVTLDIQFSSCTIPVTQGTEVQLLPILRYITSYIIVQL